MAPRLVVGSVNTILYCANWRETVDFYLRSLGLSVTHSTDWFVEFELSNGARLSVADETRSRIKSVRGQGITLSWQVANADETWDWLQARGLVLEPVRDHPWGARAFYLFDPEGHRLEFWSPQ